MGAIVGGVVGGVAIIIFGGLGIFFLLWRRKRTPAADPTPAQPVMVQQPPPAPPMNQIDHAQQQPYPPVTSSFPDSNMMSSPAPPNPHLSMISGPVSMSGGSSPTAWNQHPSPPPPFHTSTSTHEMPGPEAREQEAVYEICTGPSKM